MENALNLNNCHNSLIKRFFLKINKLWNKIWNNKLNTFIFLSLVLITAIAFVLISHTFNKSFLNYSTDDVVQYYAYIDGTFNRIKHGNFSLYDDSLIGGMSFFASVYYIPYDIFLFYAFIMSYIMPSACAYLLSNMLRIMCGSLIMYYFFIRKGFKTKAAFLASLIMFVSGVVEAEFIFDAYLGILVYAPLGMLVADLFLDNYKKYFLLIPLYGFTIVVYNYYISYMLFALFSIYFVIECHLRYKKFFILNKDFWLKFLIFMSLIVLSLLMSLFMLLPGAMFVIEQTNRSGQAFEGSIWYYGSWANRTVPTDGHYFTQLINFFIPNSPFDLGLNPVNKYGYVTEHASLYMCVYGAIFLITFFFINNRKANRLKFWVIIFNIMLAIPLFAMIFTANEWWYIRWFFIPFYINYYAMAYSMNHYGLKFSDKNYKKLLAIIIIGFVFALLLYIVFEEPAWFLHYKSQKGVTGYSGFFYPVLIGSLIVTGTYFVLLTISYFYQLFKYYKGLKIVYKILPFVAFAEIIYAGVIPFQNTGWRYYLPNATSVVKDKNYIYNLGFEETNGFRINMFTPAARSMTNTNIVAGKTNQSSFFQSFYNNNLDTYNYQIHNFKGGKYNVSWSQATYYGYGLLNAPMFNVKYIIAEPDCNDIRLPIKYYKKIGNYKTSDNKNVNYYENESLPPFIVYDDVFEFDHTNFTKFSSFHKDVALLNYAYVATPEVDSIDDNNKENQKLLDNREILTKNGFEIKNTSVIEEIKADPRIKMIYITNHHEDDVYDKSYFLYKLSKYPEILSYDAIYYESSVDRVYYQNGGNAYIRFKREDATYYYPTHYNMIYLNNLEYAYDGELLDFMITRGSTPEDKKANTSKFYAFDFGIYDDFIERQNKYTDKEFKLNGTNMHIKFKNYDTSKPKIVKTAYTYTNEWKTDKYETVNINGGFLGIVIPKGEEYIDINLKFNPSYFSTSLKISLIGCIIYAGLITTTIIIYKKKKEKRINDEDNINNSAML